MNDNIRTICKPDDKKNYIGQSPRTIAFDALCKLKYATPYSTTFLESVNLTTAQRAALEAELKAKFEQWAEMWVAPQLRAIIAKGHPHFKSK